MTTHPQTFGQWLAGELVARGYDLSERGGGRRAFAQRAGLGPAIVSRVLRDAARPDIATCGKIAAALGVTRLQILARAGYIPADEVPIGPAPAHISQRDALDALGVHSREDQEAVLALIRALRARREPQQER